jgi:peptide deformylase
MILKIAQLGQPVLRRPALEVASDELKTPQFQQLIDDMLSTLAQERGAGLAGPQVFAGKRLFVAAVQPPTEPEAPLGVEVFINPQIVAASAETASAWEGCLSFPELMVLVPRYQAVRIQYLNRHGDAQTLDLHGFPARVVQHETDHLHGILTIDRAESTLDIIKASEIDAVEE